MDEDDVEEAEDESEVPLEMLRLPADVLQVEVPLRGALANPEETARDAARDVPPGVQRRALRAAFCACRTREGGSVFDFGEFWEIISGGLHAD